MKAIRNISIGLAVITLGFMVIEFNPLGIGLILVFSLCAIGMNNIIKRESKQIIKK